MDDSTLTAEVRADGADDAVVGRRVIAAWTTVGRPSRFATVAGAVLATAAAATWMPESRAVPATALSVLIVLVAAVVDAVERRLPNALVGAAAVPVLVALAAAWVTGPTDLVRGAVVGAAFLGGPLMLTHLASPSGMGFGDVKAGAVLGAALGLVNAQIAVLALLIGLSGAAGWAVVGRHRSIALGPGLVAGAVAALLLARWMNVEANR